MERNAGANRLELLTARAALPPATHSRPPKLVRPPIRLLSHPQSPSVASTRLSHHSTERVHGQDEGLVNSGLATPTSCLQV